MQQVKRAKIEESPDTPLPWATERRLLLDHGPENFERDATTLGWTDTLYRVEQLIAPNLGSLRGAHIADVGCGPGILLKRLWDQYSARGATTTGLDASLEMLLSARHRLGQHSRLIQYDLAWPLTPRVLAVASCDVLICTGALQLAPDYRNSLRDFARALRPGGTLALAVPESYGPQFEPSCRRISLPELFACLSNAQLCVSAHEQVDGYRRSRGGPMPYSLIVAMKQPSSHRPSQCFEDMLCPKGRWRN